MRGGEGSDGGRTLAMERGEISSVSIPALCQTQANVHVLCCCHLWAQIKTRGE